MSTTTNISRLKARLSSYLRAVQRGQQVVVTDRDQPIARLVPYEAKRRESDSLLMPRDPTAPPLGQVAIDAIAYRGTHVVDDLLAERRRR